MFFVFFFPSPGIVPACLGKTVAHAPKKQGIALRSAILNMN
jgi:hypothetical protein